MQVRNFEIKPAIIQMIQQTIQFGGSSQEDDNVYITNFLEICNTFKYNEVTDDAIHLTLSFLTKRQSKTMSQFFTTKYHYFLEGLSIEISSKIFHFGQDS